MRILIALVLPLLLASCAGTKMSELSESGNALKLHPDEAQIVTFFRGNEPTLGDSKEIYMHFFCPVEEGNHIENCNRWTGYHFLNTGTQRLSLVLTIPVVGAPGWRMYVSRAPMKGTGLHAFTEKESLPGTNPHRTVRVGTFTYTAQFAPNRLVVIPSTGDNLPWVQMARDSLRAGLGDQIDGQEFVLAKRVSAKCKDIDNLLSDAVGRNIDCVISDR